jgi:hypothetical protein
VRGRAQPALGDCVALLTPNPSPTRGEGSKYTPSSSCTG